MKQVTEQNHVAFHISKQIGLVHEQKSKKQNKTRKQKTKQNRKQTNKQTTEWVRQLKDEPIQNRARTANSVM